MSPRLSSYVEAADPRRAESGVDWASIVAILFAAIAAISFAVDQSVTLAN